MFDSTNHSMIEGIAAIKVITPEPIASIMIVHNQSAIE